ncbi:MAG: beta-galactosidase trimerization domain-containing protein, partial [Kiritimatiellae bacterium]|nr:beta-galactosidase trimerization domain-containing protein [Kiritimatiellia bacterium]
MAAFPPLPWRKADIEYHNSRHVARLAERFDAEAFAEQLVKARVNGATVFAKDMYGYFYYPNAHGPVHPGLSFDLFGAQVAALRKRKIHVLAYYMTTCNPVLANRHPEWLIVRDRAAAQASEHERAFTGDYQPAGAGAGAPQPAAQRDTAQDEDKEYEIWKWKFCLANEAYVQWDLACIRELVSRYEIDALWLDQAHARACFCPDCLRHLREQGLDPFDNGVQHRHKVAIKNAFLKRIQQVVKETRPACLVCPQCEASFGMTERAPLMDYSDIEVLPTDDVHYGYDYCATMLRFQRGHGVPTYGLTTRFKGYWADFGGLKLPAQLQLEAATFVANGARCNIGDQLHPNGRLDPAVYHVIGKVYRHIEKIEPYLEQAVPVTEAALVITGPTLGRPRGAVNYGWVKLLVESRMQFDVVEPDTPWERYGLILLPEDLPVEKAMATRLQAFIAGGGAVIAAHNAGLVAGTERSWLARYGLRYAGP